MSAHKTLPAGALILQALGTIETDAQAGLSCVLGMMHAEAEMLVMGENLGPRHEMLEHAHAARLKALEDLVDDYLIVSWRETAEDRAAADAELQAARNQGPRAVPTRGAS